MASFTGKPMKDVYKDLLHTDNSNTGLSTTIKQIKCGDGDTTALYLSSQNAKIQPGADSTTNTVIYDASGNALITVDSTNDLVKLGIGQHTANTQFKSFGLWDFSPSAGEHHNLTTSPMITSASDGDFTGEVNGSAWGGTGTNPATSLVVASAALELIPSLWLLPSDITIDSVQYVMASDAASTINLHVMSYSMNSGSGSTAGDLSSGVVVADGSNITNAGYEQIYYQAMTVQSADVDAGKVIMFTFASDTVNSDYSISANIKYHVR